MGRSTRAIMKCKAGPIVVLASMVLAGHGVAHSGSAEDPYRHLQWGLEMIGAPAAWSHSTGDGAVIAVVDTGIDRQHPDLASKLTTNFFNPCGGTGLTPTDNHGTHVAGIAAAATNNSIGVAGVAPHARIMDVKVLGGGCEARSFSAGLRFAVDNGAHVINASLGYDELKTMSAALGISEGVRSVRQALRYAWNRGVLIVGSAGNSRLPFCSEPWHKSPVLCVGAVNSRGMSTAYSNSDASGETRFLVAPGGEPGVCDSSIISTVRSDIDPDARCLTTLGRGYGPMSGTSMAAPHVAGVAALLVSKGLTAREIVDCLLSTAVDLGPHGRDPVYGSGLVDAEAAVRSCGG